jgi:hypothetical protein
MVKSRRQAAQTICTLEAIRQPPPPMRQRLRHRVARLSPGICRGRSRLAHRLPLPSSDSVIVDESTILLKLPLLITESADEFDAVRDAFEREIQPRGIVEQMYVDDISCIVWEILRLRRCKVVISMPLFARPWKIFSSSS